MMLYLLFLPLVCALPWDGPIPTAVIEIRAPEYAGDAVALPIMGPMHPAPTNKPRDFLDVHQAWKRQTVSSISSFRSSSSVSKNTCGFLSGSASHAFTCDVSYTCAIATKYNANACCKTPSVCEIPTTCIAYTAIPSCAANPACQADRYATKCNIVEDYCNSLIVLGVGNVPATNLYCDSTPAIDTIWATATDGDKGTASYVFVTLSPATLTPTSPTSTTIPTSSSTPTPTPSPTTSPGRSSITPTPTPSHSSDPSPVPIGAIVGGSVGGIAVIAAVAVGIFILLRKKKGSSPPPNPQQSQPVAEAGAGGYNTNNIYPTGKEAYQTTSSPVSPQPPQYPTYNQGPVYGQEPSRDSYVPYTPMSSPPQSPPPPQQQPPNQNYPIYPHGVSEIEGTAMSANARPGY